MTYACQPNKNHGTRNERTPSPITALLAHLCHRVSRAARISRNAALEAQVVTNELKQQCAMQGHQRHEGVRFVATLQRLNVSVVLPVMHGQVRSDGAKDLHGAPSWGSCR